MKVWRDSVGRLLRTQSNYALYAWFLLLSLLLYQRPLGSNFIFDEQEALLKNPFLRANVPAWRAFHVDFWGRDPVHTIGSYRPLPVALWKLLAPSLSTHTPLAFVGLNLLVHAACGVLLACIIARVLALGPGIPGQRATKYGQLLGLVFVVHGLVTETVCYAVGLADALMALLSLCMVSGIVSTVARAGARRRGFEGQLLGWLLVGGSLFLGLLCKETMVGSLLAGPLIALLLASPSRKSGFVRTKLALLCPVLVGVLSLASLAGYIELRKAFFPAASLDAASPMYPRGTIAGWSKLMEWLALPPIPSDALNNPLIAAPLALRWPTACVLWLKQTGQMLVPWPLVSDYSFPSELPRAWDAGAWVSVGCLLLLATYIAGLLLRQASALLGFGRARALSPWERLLALGGLLWLCSYVPVSNTLFLLPTIRGERLLYLPLLGFLMTVCGSLGVLAPHVNGLLGLFKRSPTAHFIGQLTGALYLISLGVAGRVHALSYVDDLVFWSAAAHAPHPSAKSYLNLGIMLGARGDLDARLLWTKRALGLAPDWPMAHVYLGDVWCRKRDLRAAEAPYIFGLALAKDNKDLTALALQCIWESGSYADYRPKLHALTKPQDNTWLSYFLYELDEHGAQNAGIPQKYRPLGYNRAPE